MPALQSDGWLVRLSRGSGPLGDPGFDLVAAEILDRVEDHAGSRRNEENIGCNPDVAGASRGRLIETLSPDPDPCPCP
jgi:hypothetical protein